MPPTPPSSPQPTHTAPSFIPSKALRCRAAHRGSAPHSTCSLPPCPPHPHPSPYNRRELLLHPRGSHLPHSRKGRGGAATHGEGQPPYKKLPHRQGRDVLNRSPTAPQKGGVGGDQLSPEGLVPAHKQQQHPKSQRRQGVWAMTAGASRRLAATALPALVAVAAEVGP